MSTVYTGNASDNLDSLTEVLDLTPEQRSTFYKAYAAYVNKFMIIRKSTAGYDTAKILHTELFMGRLIKENFDLISEHAKNEWFSYLRSYNPAMKGKQGLAILSNGYIVNAYFGHNPRPEMTKDYRGSKTIQSQDIFVESLNENNEPVMRAFPIDSIVAVLQPPVEIVIPARIIPRGAAHDLLIDNVTFNQLSLRRYNASLNKDVDKVPAASNLKQRGIIHPRLR